eukprot:28401-Pelagococcus_subviridis.AAC.1
MLTRAISCERWENRDAARVRGGVRAAPSGEIGGDITGKKRRRRSTAIWCREIRSTKAGRTSSQSR